MRDDCCWCQEEGIDCDCACCCGECDCDDDFDADEMGDDPEDEIPRRRRAQIDPNDVPYVED